MFFLFLHGYTFNLENLFMQQRTLAYIKLQYEPKFRLSCWTKTMCVPSSLSLFHTLPFCFVDSELSYDSPLTAGALSHDLLSPFLALLLNCTLNWVHLSLTGNYYPSRVLPAEFAHLFPLPHSCSSFWGQPLSSVMFLYWHWVYPKTWPCKIHILQWNMGSWIWLHIPL